MLALQRQQEILAMAQRQGAVRVAQLAELFNVTEETIRRDLTMLENAGRLTRSHGGAVLAQAERHEVPHHQRETLYRTEKIQIARMAVKQVVEGDTLLLDASSTALFLAQVLPNWPLTVLTNSLLVIQTLARHSQIKLVSLGGTFIPVSMSFLGPTAQRTLEEYHVNKLFFSCRGLDAMRGMTDPSEGSAQLKQHMLTSADERILLMDHSKVGVRALAVIAGLDRITQLITDEPIEGALLDQLSERSIDITYAL